MKCVFSSFRHPLLLLLLHQATSLSLSSLFGEHALFWSFLLCSYDFCLPVSLDPWLTILSRFLAINPLRFNSQQTAVDFTHLVSTRLHCETHSHMPLSSPRLMPSIFIPRIKKLLLGTLCHNIILLGVWTRAAGNGTLRNGVHSGRILKWAR